MTFNQVVAGSSPAWLMKKNYGFRSQFKEVIGIFFAVSQNLSVVLQKEILYVGKIPHLIVIRMLPKI